MIINLYIECDDKMGRSVERLLHILGEEYPYYDATDFDVYTAEGSPTKAVILEEVEMMIEGK